jgi:hypothetical protein
LEDSLQELMQTIGLHALADSAADIDSVHAFELWMRLKNNLPVEVQHFRSMLPPVDPVEPIYIGKSASTVARV